MFGSEASLPGRRCLAKSKLIEYHMYQMQGGSRNNSIQYMLSKFLLS